MKSLNYTIEKIMIKYTKWLSETYHYQVHDIDVKFTSVGSYQGLMLKAISDLKMNPHDFKHYSKPELIGSLESKIIKSKSFENRTSEIQSNIISAFRAYIKYIQTK